MNYFYSFFLNIMRYESLLIIYVTVRQITMDMSKLKYIIIAFLI